MSVISAALAALCLLPVAEAVTLERGRCGIVVAEKAFASTRFAAAELRTMLGEVLGEAPPLVSAPLTNGVSIILGDNAWSRAAGIDAAALARDAFVLRAAGDRIYICGRDDEREDLARRVKADAVGGTGQHATLFGVYEFLERFADCRFFFPGEFGTILPRLERVRVPEGETAAAPYFTSRQVYMGGDGSWYEATGGKGLHWLRLRMQTFNPPCCHGQNKFMPVERFAKDHPEYFQLRPDGTRCTNLIAGAQFDHWQMKQLCHSSGVWDEFYKDAVSYLKGEDASVRGIPSMYLKGRKMWNSNCYERRYIDMMPQDGMQICRCAACQAAYQTNRTHYATELIWGNTARFANRLRADGFKDAVITQMAYQPYMDVPTVAVPDNVLVIVAQRGPWSWLDSKKMAEEVGVFRAWSEKTGRRVRTWTYPHKYGPLRIDDVPSMAPRAWGGYFKAAAPYIIGGFCESESDKAIYNYLNYYVYSRVAWNPETDVEAVLADHHRRMFGKGAAAMARFYDALEATWLRRIAGNVTMGALGPVAKVPDEYSVWTEVFSRERLAEWSGWFDEARAAAADDPGAVKRIRFIRAQFLEPLEARVKAYAEQISVARGLRLRETEENRSILAGGELDSLDGWTVKGGENCRATVDGAVKCRGAASVRIDSVHTYAFIEQDLEGRLKPDTEYRVSFFMKLENVCPVGDKGHRGACVELADGGWKFLPPASAWCGTRDWTYHDYRLRTGKQLRANPKLLLILFNAQGTVWFDDIRVEETR